MIVLAAAAAGLLALFLHNNAPTGMPEGEVHPVVLTEDEEGMVTVTADLMREYFPTVTYINFNTTSLTSDNIDDYLMDDDDDEYDDEYDEDDDYEDISDEDDADDQDEYDFGTETLYEVKCPTCGEVITIDEEMLDEGATTCPNCGEELEFDMEDEEPEDK